MKKFILYHFNQIKKEGLKAVLRKIKTGIIYIFEMGLYFLLFFPILFILVFIRIIRNIKLIRFGYFVTSRIGHFGTDVGILFAEYNLQSKKTLDFYYYRKPISNLQWFQMTKRNFHISYFAKYFYNLDKLIWNVNSHRISPPIVTTGSRDPSGLLEKFGKSIPFNNSENEFCKKWLLNKGIHGTDKFVCLLVRDESYLKNQSISEDYSYHDYRDSDISTYKKSVHFLLEKGYAVIRMAKVANKKLECSKDKFIDYPFLSDQHYLLDIWLMANCFFAISTGTGLDSISDIYRIPVVYLNINPIGNINSWSRAISVPKNLKWETTGNYLNLGEHLDNHFHNSYSYKDKGIIFENLSEIDILDGVTEMELKLSGKWATPSDESVLQDKFWQKIKDWKNFSNYHNWIHPKATIGYHFLKKVGIEFLK